MPHILNKKEVSNAYKKALHGITNNLILIPGVSKDDELMQLSALTTATNKINKIFPVHISKVSNVCIMDRQMYSNFQNDKEFAILGMNIPTSSNIIVENNDYKQTVTTFIHEYGHSIYTNILEINDSKLHSLLSNIVTKLANSFPEHHKEAFNKCIEVKKEYLLDYIMKPTEIFARAFTSYVHYNQHAPIEGFFTEYSDNPTFKEIEAVHEEFTEILSLLKENLISKEGNISPEYKSNLTQDEKNLITMYEYKLYSDQVYNKDINDEKDLRIKVHRKNAIGFNKSLFYDLNLVPSKENFNLIDFPSTDIQYIPNMCEGVLAMGENYLLVKIKELNNDISKLEKELSDITLAKTSQIAKYKYENKSKDDIDCITSSFDSDIRKIESKITDLKSNIDSCNVSISEIKAHDNYDNDLCNHYRNAYYTYNDPKNMVISPKKYKEASKIITRNETFTVKLFCNENFNYGIHCKSETPSYPTDKARISGLIDEIYQIHKDEFTKDELDKNNPTIKMLKDMRHPILVNIKEKDIPLIQKTNKIRIDNIEKIKNGMYLDSKDKVKEEEELIL